jgi:hypothetical protein
MHRTKSWTEVKAENRLARIANMAIYTDAELTKRALRHESEFGHCEANFYMEELRRRQAVGARELELAAA